jgi:hypothetical protein
MVYSPVALTPGPQSREEALRLRVISGNNVGHDEYAGKGFRIAARRTLCAIQDIGPVRSLACTQVAASREDLLCKLGKEELPKSATAQCILHCVCSFASLFASEHDARGLIISR